MGQLDKSTTARGLRDLSATELVNELDHSLHVQLRERLGKLETLVRQATRALADDPAFPADLAGRVEVFAIDLTDHLEKEERVLFPAVRRGLGIELTPAVRVMRAEHADLLESLSSIEAAARTYAGPRVPTPHWRAFLAAFETFDALLRDQIAVEDEVLFQLLCAR